MEGILMLILFLGLIVISMKEISREKFGETVFKYEEVIGVLIFLVLIGVATRQDLNYSYSCFSSYKPTYGLFNLVANFVSILFFSFALKAKKKSSALILLLSELSYFLIKMILYSNYETEFIGFNNIKMMLYDYMGLIVRTYLIILLSSISSYRVLLSWVLSYIFIITKTAYFDIIYVL